LRRPIQWIDTLLPAQGGGLLSSSSDRLPGAIAWRISRQSSIVTPTLRPMVGPNRIPRSAAHTRCEDDPMRIPTSFPSGRSTRKSTSRERKVLTQSEVPRGSCAGQTSGFDVAVWAPAPDWSVPVARKPRRSCPKSLSMATSSLKVPDKGAHMIAALTCEELVSCRPEPGHSPGWARHGAADHPVGERIIFDLGWTGQSNAP